MHVNVPKDAFVAALEDGPLGVDLIGDQEPITETDAVATYVPRGWKPPRVPRSPSGKRMVRARLSPAVYAGERTDLRNRVA
jgi:hypothetical protein